MNARQEGLAAFAEALGDGISVVIQIVRGNDFFSTYDAARSGDEDAQRFLVGLRNFDKQTEDAEKRGEYPACFACDCIVGQHNFGGLAVATASDRDGPGIASAFCDDCTSKGPQFLCDAFKETIGDQFDVGFETLQ